MIDRVILRPWEHVDVPKADRIEWTGRMCYWNRWKKIKNRHDNRVRIGNCTCSGSNAGDDCPSSTR